MGSINEAARRPQSGVAQNIQHWRLGAPKRPRTERNQNVRHEVMKRSEATNAATMDMHDIALFWSKVEINNPNDCWIWKAASTGRYGSFRGVAAHRLSWELVNGRSLGDLYACHHCDVTHCVNPDHLFAGTHQDNMADMMSKGRQKGQNKNGTKGESAKPLCETGQEDYEIANEFET